MTAGGDDQLLGRLRAARSRIDDAASAAGRDPAEVRLLLATKTQPAQRILSALAAGYTLIGENRVQEVTAKAADLSAVAHETHFIGHLQANKINQLLDHIDCLETLDSAELARKLDTRLAARDRTLDVLLQVNVSGEASKSGVRPDEVTALLEAAAECPRLAVRGFMTIGLNSADTGAVRAGFRLLGEIQQEALSGTPGATELSMGMSGDFTEAIAEGATIVRLGSAVFGPRSPAGSG
jgi:hypothetical protein